MKHEMRFRPEVADDIADACRWYEEQRIGLAKSFLAELHATLTRISAQPYMVGLNFGEVRSARMHRFPYLVHFRVMEGEILIVGVMHGGRHPSTWQDRV